VEPTLRCGRWDEYQIYQDCVHLKHPNGTLIYLRDIQCGFPIQTTNSTAHSYPYCSVLCCICVFRSYSMLLRAILSNFVLRRSVLCVPCRAVPFCSGSWGVICFCAVFHCALLCFSCFRCVLLCIAVLCLALLSFALPLSVVTCLLCSALLYSIVLCFHVFCVVFCCVVSVWLCCPFRCPTLL
jgi:hypothetical protein